MKVREIVQILGGPCSLARELGIRSQAVSLWIRKNRVPAERVPTLERLARERGNVIYAEQIRPDIEWHVLRGRP